ncbi:MAG: PqqD family protein [Acidimicrobiia bacterium]
MSEVSPGARLATIDRHSALSRSDAVHTVVLDGEGVLLDEHENRLHLLNSSATLLWQLYDGATTLDDLAADISATLHADHEAVVADLVAMSRHLAEEGLLAGFVRVDPDAEPEAEAEATPDAT